MTTPRGKFNQEQVAQLLRPVHPNRVMKANGHSHLSQQDVRAHMIRIFGFGNFDTKITRMDCLFEEPFVSRDGREAPGRYNVCYRVTIELSIRNENGELVQVIEDGSTGYAQNQNRGDAHDLAMKSAISLAFKRATTYEGDQFGLSLYNKGQETALVMGTMVGAPPRPEKGDGEQGEPDVQSGVALQLEDGHREEGSGEPVESSTDVPPDVAPAAEGQSRPPTWQQLLDGATTVEELQQLYRDAVKGKASAAVINKITEKAQKVQGEPPKQRGSRTA